MPDTGAEDKVELAKWYDTTLLPTEAKTRLFGELVKRATPIVRTYISDLYHDAMFLKQYEFRQDEVLYYAIDDGGTHIGVSRIVLDFRKDAQYEIRIRKEDRGVWYAVFTDITPQKEAT